MKTRINYITFDSWWDTDKTIIPSIAEIANLKVFCLTHSYSSSKEPHKKVPANVSLIQLNQKYRNNDLRSIWYAFKLIYLAYLKNKNKNTVYFVTPPTNIWFYLLLVIFFPKSRTIISSHNYLEHGDAKGFSSSLKERIKKWAYERFKYFHFYSNYQLLLFKKDYPEKQAFFTSMPPKDYGPIPSTLREDTKIHLLFFGSIRDYKRLDWLIKAAKKVDTSKLRFVIAGNASPDDERKYLEMIGNDDSFDVHLGFVSNEDIPKYFADTDFLVLPYRSATQSGPSMIAINYGVPIIASDVPAFKELITDGGNGFLFMKDSIESLSSILGKVSKMSMAEVNKMKASQFKFKEEYLKTCHIGQCFSQFINQNITI